MIKISRNKKIYVFNNNFCFGLINIKTNYKEIEARTLT